MLTQYVRGKLARYLANAPGKLKIFLFTAIAIGKLDKSFRIVYTLYKHDKEKR